MLNETGISHNVTFEKVQNKTKLIKESSLSYRSSEES